ncbi:serine hydrolase [Halovivax sp.]|uniref:serine hydrolase n=1 Tax=Halovivax sp. TaxID=1935978 RepID=UPI0025BFF9E4|nr:serine hydrolase [Halovivax sp.]
MADTLSADRRREIETFVTDWMHEEEIPGASLLLVDGEEVIYERGFGARDLERNEPATPETLYGFASISKSVAALALMQLAEDGDLSVDDPVSEYVDYYDDAPGEPITIEGLLTHTSGMPSTGAGLISQYYDLEPAGPMGDWEDHRSWVRQTTDLRAIDRDRFFYYNTGYSVLSQIVEAVDGRRYADYVTEEIFEPLGMERSTYDREEFEGDDDAMTPYRVRDGEREEVSFPFGETSHGSGGMLSSVRELSRYLRAMMTDGEFDGGRVCSADSVEELQAPRTTRLHRLDGEPQHYGYGYIREPLLDDELIGHSGSILVSTAYMGYLADEGLGVILACNASPERHPRQIAPGVLALALGEEPTAVPQLALREKLESVTGRYEGFREGMVAEVERVGGELRMTMKSSYGDREIGLQPESLDPDDTTFRTTLASSAEVPVEFDLDGETADLYHMRYRLQRV